MANLADFRPTTGRNEIDAEQRELHLYITNVETTSSYGSPIVNIFGREEDGTFHHIKVDGHKPSFLIRADDYNKRLDNHYAVSSVVSAERKTMFGDELYRVYTTGTEGLKELRDMFDITFEADVWFQHRFLLDKGIKTGVRISMKSARKRDGCQMVRTSAVRAAPAPDVDPRVVTVDIEVVREDGFPTPSKAHWPVVSVVAHDSQTDETKAWYLRSDEWNNPFMQFDECVTVYDSETAMLNDMFYWIGDRQPDILGGWYSNNFDWPYLIQRAKNKNITAYREISPMGEAWVSSRWGDPSAKGVTFLDYLDGYKKTQFHKKNSYALDDIASDELGRGKLDLFALVGAPQSDNLIYAWAWRNEPETFIDYNIRDVHAVVEIDREKEITSLFHHLRSISGSLFGDLIGNNINMIDNLVLHEAHDNGIALPTSVKPEEDWYFGGYVFDPKAGLHYNVVYPDYASLYPNMMAQVNMSPETLVGTATDLLMSPYTEEDCIWSHVDTRPVKRVEAGADYNQYKDGTYKAIMKQKSDGTWETKWMDEPKLSKMYFLKHEVKQGFVSGVVEKLLDMKYDYKGTDMYMAVKQVCNSVYGVFGDSNSFGRGFRLFDWRIAEAITLGGQQMLKNGAKRFMQAVRTESANAYLAGGDTDSVMTAIPDAEDDWAAFRIAQRAAEVVNKWHDDFCKETFGIDEHRMEIEIESVARRCFFAQDESREAGVGKKKRYVSHLTIKDGEAADDMKIKGFEAVRSDRAPITVEVQKKVFHAMMYETEADMFDVARSEITAVLDGRVDPEKLGIPFGMSKRSPQDYFKEGRRTMPWYHGAAFANKHIYSDGRINSDVDAVYFYVADVSMAPIPNEYGPESGAANGDPVECLAVLSPRDMPSGVVIDYDKMVEKTLKNPLKPIIATMGWEWSELTQK